MTIKTYTSEETAKYKAERAAKTKAERSARKPELIWDSKKQGTFIGSIQNELINVSTEE